MEHAAALRRQFEHLVPGTNVVVIGGVSAPAAIQHEDVAEVESTAVQTELHIDGKKIADSIVPAMQPPGDQRP